MSLSKLKDFGSDVTVYTCSLILIIGLGAPKNLRKNSIDERVPFDLYMCDRLTNNLL